jgi:hypothetical protein
MKEEIRQATAGISPIVNALDLQLCRAAEAAGTGEDRGWKGGMREGCDGRVMISLLVDEGAHAR